MRGLKFRVMEFIERITLEHQAGRLPNDIFHTLRNFYAGYFKTLEQHSKDYKRSSELLDRYIDEVIKQTQDPYLFDAYHQKVTSPYDYQEFGKEFIRPLVLTKESTVCGQEVLREMLQAIRKGENVVLLANHQTEADPQIINLLLEDLCPKEASEMIFVAGHRVTTDPLSIPFSMGCNLICIHSKKHIDHPPELKQSKLLHNQKAMRRMSELFGEGGKWIYVAPSGGRDRPDGKGNIPVAPYDPQSIEMIYLMAKSSKKPTHFHTLALSTYHVLPPPDTVEKDIGEKRVAQCSPAHLAFGKEIPMESFPGSEEPDKKLRRSLRAEYIWKQACHDYSAFNH